MLIKAILHAADIGNAIRPFQVNDTMSKRVHKEFEVLAEEEKRLGIPVTFAIESKNPLMCAQVIMPTGGDCEGASLLLCIFESLEPY
jgi:hypothetical protein